ncbi:hypothetical protein FB45DRAFT_1036065 [Roridomyces roridus]|uniref:Uncharacterized protein n=1 Tax=Roridomyces roridus TaxID=1738132 RepID=A0AAD7FEE0_9AGAR|nr:hypothetical protein FB45DRAFT_1036065 [Roridomyces roridus]
MLRTVAASAATYVELQLSPSPKICLRGTGDAAITHPPSRLLTHLRPEIFQLRQPVPNFSRHQRAHCRRCRRSLAQRKTAAGPLATALRDDLDQSIVLGFKMISDLSSGMDYLSTQGITLPRGPENFDVFLDVNDRFLVSIFPLRILSVSVSSQVLPRVLVPALRRTKTNSPSTSVESSLRRRFSPTSDSRRAEILTSDIHSLALMLE